VVILVIAWLDEDVEDPGKRVQRAPPGQRDIASITTRSRASPDPLVERRSDTIARPSPPVVSPRAVQSRPRPHGDVLTAISDGIVALLKDYYGRGPTRAKSYYEDDLVVCLLRGGFSRVEQTLLEGGRGSAVIQQRMEFQELMRERFEAVIEGATGRPVIGFMSGNQQAPDIMSEVFILAPTDLVDDHEVPGRRSSSA
jgi:uncharacterized protein YbcI